MTDANNPRPVPLDLTRHVGLIEGAHEFVRLWMRPDGVTACFINPVPVGPDPAGFGAALADCIRQGAKTYARAVNIDEDEALMRIWQGLEAERERARQQRRDDPIQFVPRREDH